MAQLRARHGLGDCLEVLRSPARRRAPARAVRRRSAAAAPANASSTSAAARASTSPTMLAARRREAPARRHRRAPAMLRGADRAARLCDRRRSARRARPRSPRRRSLVRRRRAAVQVLEARARRAGCWRRSTARCAPAVAPCSRPPSRATGGRGLRGRLRGCADARRVEIASLADPRCPTAGGARVPQASKRRPDAPRSSLRQLDPRPPVPTDRSCVPLTGAAWSPAADRAWSGRSVAELRRAARRYRRARATVSSRSAAAEAHRDRSGGHEATDRVAG